MPEVAAADVGLEGGDTANSTVFKGKVGGGGPGLLDVPAGAWAGTTLPMELSGRAVEGLPGEELRCSCK